MSVNFNRMYEEKINLRDFSRVFLEHPSYIGVRGVNRTRGHTLQTYNIKTIGYRYLFASREQKNCADQTVHDSQTLFAYDKSLTLI